MVSNFSMISTLLPTFQTKEMMPITLRKRRQRIKSEANWSLFYYQFNRDHAKPNLIWNYKVRCKIFNKVFYENQLL